MDFSRVTGLAVSFAMYTYIKGLSGEIVHYTSRGHGTSLFNEVAVGLIRHDSSSLATYQ